MGKAKRLKVSQKTHRPPLEIDIENSTLAKSKNRNKFRLRKDEEDEQFIDSVLSRKILSAARSQQRELVEGVPNAGSSKPSQFPKLGEDNESGSESDEEQNTTELDSYYENVQINEEDELAIEMFMSSNPKPRQTLADIIMEKITEKETELEMQFTEAGPLKLNDVDPRLAKYFTQMGEVLKRYRRGKLPKGFKQLPSYKNWEQLLQFTDPTSWSAAAMYQGTRIFASNLTDKTAHRFYEYVLLPRIRDDITEYKRLNFHLYQALKKALYKPGSFNKGIILPLLQSGTCTLREAIIIGSVVATNSLPVIHSATAIQKIAQMDYTGANSILLRIYFDKKYNLPLRVVDEVCSHFLRFRSDSRELPVLWHQALLSFVQRYKNDLLSDYRDDLLQLLRKHKHHEITPEIRRELENAKCRDPAITGLSMDTN